METVIEVTIPPDQFVLAETIERIPTVEFEVVRLALQHTESMMPFLWGAASQPDQLDAALQTDPATDRVTCLSSGADRGLYAIAWTASATSRINEFAETSGSVLAIHGTADQWTVQTLFSDRETASETFQSWCDDGINPSLSRVSTISREKEAMTGLSSMQYSTIAHAFQTEYYSVPRGITLDELATELDVSHQALSERLRRGHSHLAERMLADPPIGMDGRP